MWPVNKLNKIYHPEIFQGNKNKKNYFEGWYFKNVGSNSESVFSFIPGIALSREPHSFIQVINGITGETHYVTYKTSEFEYTNNPWSIRVGDSRFSDKGIQLNIQTAELKVNGSLEYSHIIKYPQSLLNPGIMGWYSFVPTMECNHAVVNVDNKIMGSLSINGNVHDFTNGKGYIEKDWGISFPESWIWLQCNNFQDKKTSLMLSVAKIPWRGNYFIGFLGFLYCNDIYYPFATYKNSNIKSLAFTENKVVNICIENRNEKIEIEAYPHIHGTLKAPILGKMDRHVKESNDGEINIRLLTKSGVLLYEDHGSRAGLEIIPKIFTYFQNN